MASNAGKGQFDGKAILIDDKIGKLMLEDDGHILRILVAEKRGHIDPRMAGVEGDEKMVLPDDAGLRDLLENAPHDMIQAFAQQTIIV